MHDFLSDLLERIDNSGENFSSQAYNIIGSEITPLLKVMFIAYVGYYGIQVIMGTSRISVAEIVTRVFRMVFILALISNWGYFNDFFYKWLNNTPEDVGRAILTATGTGITEPTNGLSMIWKTANEAASAFAEQFFRFAFYGWLSHHGLRGNLHRSCPRNSRISQGDVMGSDRNRTDFYRLHVV